MRYLKSIYNFLNEEALPLNIAKKYVAMGKNRPSWLVDKLNELFDNQQRIYIPVVSGEVGETQEEISDFLDGIGYSIKDYKLGIAFQTDNPKREIRIGKLLNKEKQTELLKLFTEDLYRTLSKQQSEYSIVICQHPYDVTAMTTGRSWTSCLEILGGANREFIPEEIRSGTIVAYYIKSSDKNINEPLGRVNVKLYSTVQNDGIDKNESFPYNWVWIPDTGYYGSFPMEGRGVLMNWLENVQGVEFYDEIYFKLKGLYNWKGTSYNIYLGELFNEVQEIHNTLQDFTESYNYEPEYDFYRVLEEGGFEPYKKVLDVIFSQNMIKDEEWVIDPQYSEVDENIGDVNKCVATATPSSNFKIDYSEIGMILDSKYEFDTLHIKSNYNTNSWENVEILDSRAVGIGKDALNEIMSILFKFNNGNRINFNNLILTNLKVDNFGEVEKYCLVSERFLENKVYNITLNNCNSMALETIFKILPLDMKKCINVLNSPGIKLEGNLISLLKSGNEGKINTLNIIQDEDDIDEYANINILIKEENIGQNIDDIEKIIAFFDIKDVLGMGKSSIYFFDDNSTVIPSLKFDKNGNVNIFGCKINFKIDSATLMYLKSLNLNYGLDGDKLLTIRNGVIERINDFPRNVNIEKMAISFRESSNFNFLVNGNYKTKLPDNLFELQITGSRYVDLNKVDSINIDITNPNIEHLYIGDFDCRDMKFLDGVDTMKNLSLYDCKLETLVGMPKVYEKFKVPYNKLKNLDGINIEPGCILEFSNNHIESVDGLSALKTLYNNNKNYNVDDWIVEKHIRMENYFSLSSNSMKSYITDDFTVLFPTLFGEDSSTKQDEDGNFLIDGNVSIDEEKFEILSKYKHILQSFIIDGNFILFDIDTNPIELLNTFPKYISGDIKISSNHILDVDFSTLQRTIKGDFIFSHNKKLKKLSIGDSGLSVIDGDCIITKNWGLETLEISLECVRGDLKLTEIATPNIIFKNRNIEISGDLDLSYSWIKSIDYNFPNSIDGSVILKHTNLKSVKGLPSVINKDLHLQGLTLDNLDGFPKEINENLYVTKEFGFTEEEVRSICKIGKSFIITK